MPGDSQNTAPHKIVFTVLICVVWCIEEPIKAGENKMHFSVILGREYLLLEQSNSAFKSKELGQIRRNLNEPANCKL